MNLLVVFIERRRRKCLGALLTLVWFFSSMYSLVFAQVALISIPFAAVLTHILKPSVDLFMITHCTVRNKRLITNITFVWLFSGVNPFVRGKTEFRRKLFTAELARHHAVPCMRSLVNTQALHRCIRFIAFVALECQFLPVSVAVAARLLHSRKLASTYFTDGVLFFVDCHVSL